MGNREAKIKKMVQQDGIIDLHMHTLHSDGELIPAELVRRAQAAGYQALALTDHADQSNLDDLVPRIVVAAKELSQGFGLTVLGGVELTHVPPVQIPGLIRWARELGAEVVVVHGESPVEPVAEGTNRAAILGRADILAHPGFLPLTLARLAKQQGVALELTARAGHSLTNGHVARVGAAAGCALVVDSDAHAPGNILSLERIRTVVMGAGLPASTLASCHAQAQKILRRAGR